MSKTSKQPWHPALFTLATCLLTSAVFIPVIATSAHAQSTPAQLKSTSGSVIRTSDPGKTKHAIQKYGLRSKKITPLPKGGALITLENTVSEFNTQMLKQELQADTGFKIFPNYTYKPTLSPNDPLYANGSQWNLTKMNAANAWDTTTGSQDTTIAVIDSGVLFSQSWADSTDCPLGSPCTQADFPSQKTWTNPGENGTTPSEGATPNCTSQGLPLDKSCNNIDDDSNGFIDDSKGWDFMGGWRGDSAVCPNFASPTTYENTNFPDYVAYDNDPQPYSCDSPTYKNELNRNHYDGTCEAFESACYVSHGTAVASVAAAATDNNAHIAGVDWNAKVMSLRALDGYGWGDSASITAAIEYATTMDANVINLSLAVYSNGSCTVTDTLLENALVAAKAAGIVTVAAAGNGGTEGVCYPGRSAQTMAVGASNSTDSRASFSSYGPELDLVAPGAAIPAALAPNKAGGYASSTLNTNGTSLATPHVAGLASLLAHTKPTLTPDEIRSIITQTADKVPGMNGAFFTNEYGNGRVNMAQAVNATIPSYVPLDYPRKMRLSVDTQKTNLLTLAKIGPTFTKGLDIQFTTKTLINGTWYLRSQHDTDTGSHLGIPLDSLSEIPPPYEPLSQPREMWVDSASFKTNLITSALTDIPLQRGQVIYFTTKVSVEGILYLRSQFDTDNGNHYGIPYSALKELPSYVRLDTPRQMRLTTSTQKTNLLTLDPVDATLDQGTILPFETKTFINGTWYLRSKFDSDQKLHKGIPQSTLEDL